MAGDKQILIVGGGLAGAFAAMEAAKRGHQICLVDRFSPKSASRVAAGLFNVVTGKEANKTWMADEMLASLQRFRQHPDFEWLGKFIHYMPLFRPFPDGTNYNDWMVRLQDPEFGWIGSHHGQPILPQYFQNPIGGLLISVCGWAETVGLCEGILDTLTEKYLFRRVEGQFDYKSLNPRSGSCTQEGIAGTYDEVIFAEGMGIRHNPWFQFVEIRPLKGQILEIKMEPGLSDEMVLLRKMFLIPKGNALFTAGATYELHFEDDSVTSEGIETVVQSVKDATPLSFEIMSARASIRPTTPNRRPVLGRHPDFPRLVLLNGLGTKGVLQAPFSAALLREWLDGDLPQLPKDVSVARFLKKFA